MAEQPGQTLSFFFRHAQEVDLEKTRKVGTPTKSAMVDFHWVRVLVPLPTIVKSSLERDEAEEN